jgi:hypothetical protein
MLITTGVVLALFYPLTVTWDSYLYIGSGLSLFTNHFLTDYHWLREPGFPLLFRICYVIGGYSFLVYLQFFLLVTAIFQIKRLIERLIPGVPKKTLWLGSYLALFTLAGYAAAVLQQVLFISITVALMNLVSQKKSTNQLVGIGLIAIVAALTSILLFVGLCAALFLLALVKGNIRANVVKLVLPILIFTSFGMIVESTWYVYKNSQNTTISKYPDNVNFWDKPQGSISKYETITKIPAIFAAINSFGPGNDSNIWQPVGLENKIYGTPSFTTEHSCGKFIYGPQDYISKIKVPVSSRCTNSSIVRIINDFNRVFAALIPFTSFFGFIFLLYLRRNAIDSNIGILFLPALSQFPYLIANYGGSRYGVAQLLLASFIFPMAFSHLTKIILQQKNKVSSKNTK